MNVPKVDLGEPLTKFKESTKDLSTPLRGVRLSSDPFIRKIHNSFTRRMDHLNADLALENEASEPKPKRPKGGARKGNKGGGKAKKTTIEDSAFHFIGYVERDGYVWELDGMKAKPHKLGPSPLSFHVRRSNIPKARLWMVTGRALRARKSR